MKTLALTWTLFILMGLFTSLVVPLGEGFDEPWHLGYIQYVAETGKLPPGPALHLSTELEQFLQQHPIGWRLHEIYPELHSQEEYWQQPDDLRANTDAALTNLRFSGTYSEGRARFAEEYESHQAPLYYVLTAPLFFVLERWFSLTNTFLLVRLWSVLLASTVVPLSFFLARRITGSVASANAVALLVAMFPGLYPDVVRISNDALAVPLAAAIFLALVRYLESRSRRDAWLLGLTLLAGLLTKAIFVPILLAVAMSLALLKEVRDLGTIAAATAAGWIWYIRNLVVTGSVTGLPETVSAQTSIVSSLAALGRIQWFDMFRLAAVSHIWMGNWSLLQYRSWIYKTVIAFFIVGLTGFAAYLRKASSRPIQSLLLVYAVFAASLIYYGTQVFQRAGISVIQGWYLSPVLPIEAIVFVLGIEQLFSKRFMVWISAFLAFCFLAMLLYGTAFVEAPYYSGLTNHGPSGSLRAYHPHWVDLSAMSARVTRYHSWIPHSTALVLSIAIFITGLFLIWSFLKDRKCYESSQFY